MTAHFRYVFMILGVGLVLAASAWAQSPPKLERLEVAIWPEYDQPAALVIYRGFLPVDAQLPVTVSLPMPASVAAPSAVAKRGPGTNLLNAQHAIEEAGDWKQIHVTADMPEIRLEFYVPIDTSQAERHYVFEWPGGPEIVNAAYEIMQPTGSTDFQVSPASGPPVQDSDGLFYQREDLGPIPPGGSFFIDVSYSKADTSLTAAAFPQAAQQQQQAGAPAQPASTQPAQPAPSSSAAQAPAGQSSMWLIVFVILVVAGLVGLWIVRSTAQPKE